MSSLVLYESFFGNTKKIAEAIAEGLGGPAAARLEPVGAANAGMLAGAELIVVGSATRAFRPCPETQNFLRQLGHGSLAGKRVAAFDTRIDVTKINNGFLTFMAGLFGYAAAKIDRQLVRHGGSRAGAPAGFFVTDSEGPLLEKELERAKAWARVLSGS
jgi:flavodoxin